MDIRLIQRETGRSSSVQQHAKRPGIERTFCGVKYKERNKWFDYQEDINVQEYCKWISCSKCRNYIELYLKRMRFGKTDIEKKEKLLLELASITKYRLSYLVSSIGYHNFNQLQEIRACLLHGFSFDQSLSLVDLIASSIPENHDLTVSKILRAISYGH